MRRRDDAVSGFLGAAIRGTRSQNELCMVRTIPGIVLVEKTPVGFEGSLFLGWMVVRDCTGGVGGRRRRRWGVAAWINAQRAGPRATCRSRALRPRARVRA